MGGGGGGKGGGGRSSGGDTTIRYAPYLEDAHQILLNAAYAQMDYLSTHNVYSDYIVADGNFNLWSNMDIGFFGSGFYLTSFPPIYDMYGKFMAGLDLEVLWEQIYDSMVNGPTTDAVIEAQADYLDDEMEQVSLPRIKAGLLDMNAVMSSSFIDAVTHAESQKNKTISKFSADVKMHAMDMVTGRWAKHLEWNQNVITQYMGLNRQYWASKFDYVNAWQELNTKNLLWPLTLYDHGRAVLGALNGAQAGKIAGQSSQIQRAIAGGLGGAAMGAFVLPSMFPATAAVAAETGMSASLGMAAGTGAAAGGITGPVGAIIGGLVGVGLSFLD